MDLNTTQVDFLGKVFNDIINFLREAIAIIEKIMGGISIDYAFAADDSPYVEEEE